MSSHIDILTAPTADTSGGCLYVHFDKRRYLFGRISEGTQRAFNQRGKSASSLEQLFISGEVTWKNVGGLMGLLITVADVVAGAREALAEANKERQSKGKVQLSKGIMERLDIHGADNLTYLLATARNFIFRTGMPFKAFELPEDLRLGNPERLEPDWQDNCIQVWKVPLYMLSPSKKRRRDSDGTSDKTSDYIHVKKRPEDQHILEQLVESMFNSNWRMDALVPTKLHKVDLPATIFVRGGDGSIERYTGPLPGKADNVPDIEVLVREPWPATKIHTLPQTQQSSQSMCYIVKNHRRRGKFKAAVAKELGVKPIDNKRLIAGETVPGKDDTVVTPEMVLEPDVKGNGFVVVDIAKSCYIDSFLSRPEWSSEELMDGIVAIYWILGEKIVSDTKIQDFMKSRPGIKHIVLAADTCPDMFSFESHARLTAKLQQVDPERFPTPYYSNTLPVDDTADDVPFLAGRTGKRVRTMPQFQVIDEEIVPVYDLEGDSEKVDKITRTMAAEAQAKASDPKFLSWIEEDEKDIPNRDTEITPLGTGSAMPSKYRNVSSTLIRVPGYGSYLLDCGENTLGQIRRAYGYEEANKILSELRCIFISHMHADHHLGMMTVIEAWQEVTQGTSAQLVVSCTDFMRRFIEEYSQVQPVDFGRIRFYGDHHSNTNFEFEFPEGHASGLARLQRVRVNHCKGAHAGILTWPSGLKIAYSGDCRPSSQFARAAQGATLLIHEATFEDDKVADAIAKKHSTMSEALGVAEEMGARRVLLTHFSQRYAKSPAGEEKVDGEAKKTDETVKDRVVLNAFDLMRVKLGDFRKAEVFLPAVLRLLEQESK